jgi:hypothetical protein
VTFYHRLRQEEDKYAHQQRQVIEQYRRCTDVIKTQIDKSAGELLQDVSAATTVLAWICAFAFACPFIIFASLAPLHPSISSLINSASASRPHVGAVPRIAQLRVPRQRSIA